MESNLLNKTIKVLKTLMVSRKNLHLVLLLAPKLCLGAQTIYSEAELLQVAFPIPMGSLCDVDVGNEMMYDELICLCTLIQQIPLTPFARGNSNPPFKGVSRFVFLIGTGDFFVKA